MKIYPIPKNAALPAIIDEINKNLINIRNVINSVLTDLIELQPEGPFEVPYGSDQGVVEALLPTSIIGTLENNQGDIEIPVTWVTDNYNSTELGTYTFRTILDLPEGISNSDSLTLSVEVSVMPINIDFINTPSPIDLNIGDSLAILQGLVPSTVTVTLQQEFEGSLEYVIDQPNWTYDNFDTSQANTFRVIGVPDLPEYIGNPTQLEFEIFVNVS